MNKVWKFGYFILKISYYFYIIGISKILEKIKFKGVCITLANLNQLKLFRNIHMRGIGGTSMSGIAEMLKHWGFHVTGSDDNSSELTDKLIDRGIPVTIGYDFNNLSKAASFVGC